MSGNGRKEKLSGGAVSFLRGSKLPVGYRLVAEYLDTQTNERFGNLEHRMKAGETTIVLNGSGQLNAAIAKVTKGDRLEIIYQGKDTIKGGKRAGTEAHQFEVYRVDADTPIFFEAPPAVESATPGAAASKEETKKKIDEFKNKKAG